MRSYNTSRRFFSFLELLAWPALSVGMVAIVFCVRNLFGLGIYGFDVNRSMELLIIGPAVIVVLYSLMIIIIAQVGRAGVDTAEFTGQILKVARDQLEVSQQLLRQNDTMRMSYAALAEKSPEDRPLASYATLAAAGNGKDKTSTPGLVPGSEGSDRSDLGTQILPATGTKAREALPHGAIPFLGYTILPQSGNFWVGDQFFTSLDAAKRYVELLNE